MKIAWVTDSTAYVPELTENSSIFIVPMIILLARLSFVTGWTCPLTSCLLK